jgi:GT2 family glycosyltransferase/LmbE family N-acetylglucosaminyl deacetylase
MPKALFISPHLDDVAFSCGGTVVRLIECGWSVHVCTIFTASVANPTGFALACQTDKGLEPAVDYMRLRRAEDARFAQIVGGPRLLHLAHPEAPHRGYHSARALFAGVRPDDTIWRDVAADLCRLADAVQPDLVFAPQGLGGHVDHLQVIRALDAAGLDARAIWYRDTPYIIREPQATPPYALPAGLVERPIAIDDVLARKAAGGNAYASQVGFQFGGAGHLAASLVTLARREAARLGQEGFAEALLTPPDIDPADWFSYRQENTICNLQSAISNQIEPPLASVCILNYNARHLLGRVVESVLEQTYRPVELIIVDNGSTDGSDELLAQFERVATVLRLGENTGFARGMNAGYAASHGALWVPLNVDAVLHPEFLERAAHLLAAHPAVGVLGAEVLRIGSDGDWRFWRAPHHLPSEGGVVSLTPMLRVQVLDDNADDWRVSFKPNGACPVMRRAAIEAVQARFGVGPFDPVFDTYGEDVDVAFKLWALGWRTMYARALLAGHIRSYASALELPDKRGRLRVNLLAERYLNAARHLPLGHMLRVVALALRADLTMALRQRLFKRDHEAWRDLRVALGRVLRLTPALLRFRRQHATWRALDFPHMVYCQPQGTPGIQQPTQPAFAQTVGSEAHQEVHA